jgi:hypothetical protein
MRYNVTFTLKKGKKEIKKSEVINEELDYSKVSAMKVLKRKYPDYTITILRLSLAVNAIGGIV